MPARTVSLLAAGLLGAGLALLTQRYFAEPPPPLDRLEQRLDRLEARIDQAVASPASIVDEPPPVPAVSPELAAQLLRLEERLALLEESGGSAPAAAAPGLPATPEQRNLRLQQVGEQWFATAAPGSDAHTVTLRERFRDLGPQVQLRSLECRSQVCRVRYKSESGDEEQVLEQLLAGQGRFNALHARHASGDRLLYLDFDPADPE